MFPMKNKGIAFFFLLFLSLGSCQKEKDIPSLSEDPYSFMIATDLHFLDPSLADTSSSYYRQVIDHADGKMTDYASEITDSFLKEVKRKKPDALILTGDLSWNGAQASHLRLREKLAEVEKEGIAVAILPGNHDLGAYPSVCFRGDSATSVPSASPRWFRDENYDFGPKDAVSMAADSFSYLLHPRKELYFLFLDSSSPGGNYVSKKTLAWAKGAVSSLPRSATLLTLSHQNLLVHNPLFTTGMVISNTEKVREIYASHPGKITNFAGHLHIQNVAQEEQMDEIDTASMAVYPCRYGEVQVTSLGLSYEAKAVSLEEVSKQSNDPNLIDFPSYGRSFFDAYSARAFDRFWVGEDEEAKQKAKAAFLAIQYAYFSGESLDLSPYQDTLDSLYQNAALNSTYLKSLVDDIASHPEGHLSYRRIWDQA